MAAVTKSSKTIKIAIFSRTDRYTVDPRYNDTVTIDFAVKSNLLL